jgi:hypothetical protein
MPARLVKLLASCALGIAMVTSAWAERYVTESGVQIDRCASAWFLSRFVDAEAEFSFFPAGTTPPKGVTYAFYGAHYFRVGAGCTYTTLLKAHGLEREPALRAIDTIANDTMAWRQGPQSLALAMREGVDKIREAMADDAATYEQMFTMFDLVYLSFGGEAATMKPRLRPMLDGVEERVRVQWLSRLPEKERARVDESWFRTLAKSNFSADSWVRDVSKERRQMPGFDLLLEWAEREAGSFPAEVRSQITICRKIGVQENVTK